MFTRLARWFDGLPDPVRRAARTFGQVFVVAFGLQVIAGGTFLVALTDWTTYIDSAAISGLTAVVAYVQNDLEDRGKVPVLGKSSGPLDRSH